MTGKVSRSNQELLDKVQAKRIYCHRHLIMNYTN